MLTDRQKEIVAIIDAYRAEHDSGPMLSVIARALIPAISTRMVARHLETLRADGVITYADGYPASVRGVASRRS